MCTKETNFGHQDGVDLRDLFNAQIINLHTLIDANDKSYNQRFDNVVEATKSALAASDRAVNKAEVASEKRFDAVNEFRATLSDQQRNLMPRNEVEILINGLNEKVDSLSMAAISKQSEGVGQRTGMATAALIAGVVSAVVGVLVKFV